MLEVSVNRKLVDAWFYAFHNKDISKLELAQDFMYTSPFGEIRGRRTYLDLVREKPEAFLVQRSKSSM
jgi:hypothetical protein